MILLDSHLIAEALLPTHSNTIAQDWIDQQHPQTLFLSEVSLTELKQGLKIANGNPESKRITDSANLLANYLKELFNQRILPFDEQAIIALEKVANNAKQHSVELSLMDSMIAATALAHGFQIATPDTTPFEAAGLKTINPWKT